MPHTCPIYRLKQHCSSADRIFTSETDRQLPRCPGLHETTCWQYERIWVIILSIYQTQSENIPGKRKQVHPLHVDLWSFVNVCACLIGEVPSWMHNVEISVLSGPTLSINMYMSDRQNHCIIFNLVNLVLLRLGLGEVAQNLHNG